MTSAPPRLRRTPLLARVVLALALIPAHGSAQELTGVAIGPDGGPLVAVPVVLHRVGTGSGGAFIGTDTTGSDGGFRFALPQADSAIYFAAVRYEDALYIGPAITAGPEPVGGYVLSVDPASEAGVVASALDGQRSRRPAGAPPPAPSAPSAAMRTGAGSSDAGAVVLLALLTISAVAAYLFAAPGYRHRRTRDAVIELAGIENALAGPWQPDGSDDRARLEATRDRLRNKLAPRS